MTAPFEALGYYKSSILLVGHPKVKAFGEELGLNEWDALGRWHGVLTWVAQYAPESGNLSKYPAKRVVESAGWQGDPDTFIRALVNAGLVDELQDTLKDKLQDTYLGTCFVIHDWMAWHGDAAEAREVIKSKSEGGKKGVHAKHCKAGQEYSANCPICKGKLQDTLKDTLQRRVEESKSKVEESNDDGGDSEL